jgi:hypothetical protein
MEVPLGMVVTPVLTIRLVPIDSIVVIPEILMAMVDTMVRVAKVLRGRRKVPSHRASASPRIIQTRYPMTPHGGARFAIEIPAVVFAKNAYRLAIPTM